MLTVIHYVFVLSLFCWSATSIAQATSYQHHSIACPVDWTRYDNVVDYSHQGLTRNARQYPHYSFRLLYSME